MNNYLLPRILLVLLILLAIAGWYRITPITNIEIQEAQLAIEANKRSKDNLEELIAIHNHIMGMEKDFELIHNHIMGMEKEFEAINKIISQQESR